MKKIKKNEIVKLLTSNFFPSVGERTKKKKKKKNTVTHTRNLKNTFPIFFLASTIHIYVIKFECGNTGDEMHGNVGGRLREKILS